MSFCGLLPQTQKPRLQFCSKAGLSLQTQVPRLQFCSKAGIPLQTQQTRLYFCSKAGLSLQTQEPRLLFCSRADLPPQTQEPRLQSYQGWIGMVVSSCFPQPHDEFWHFLPNHQRSPHLILDMPLRNFVKRHNLGIVDLPNNYTVYRSDRDPSITNKFRGGAV